MNTIAHRYVIEATSLTGEKTYWNASRRGWTSSAPEQLLTGPEADALQDRLVQRVQTAQIVDWVVVCERHSVWLKGFRSVIPVDSTVKHTYEDRVRARAAIAKATGQGVSHG